MNTNTTATDHESNVPLCDYETLSATQKAYDDLVNAIVTPRITLRKSVFEEVELSANEKYVIERQARVLHQCRLGYARLCEMQRAMEKSGCKSPTAPVPTTDGQ